MIVINSVELSNTLVSTNGVLLLTLEAIEEFALWEDVRTKTWGNFLNKTYKDIRLKIF